MPDARYDKNGAACSPTSRSKPSRITRNTSLLSMIIFCPKKETSPRLSLNLSWLTEPTSLLRSTGDGRFGLVCNLRCLPQPSCQRLRRLTHFVGERRVAVVYYDDWSA